ncbi:MAG TPA: ABC transporter permease subunit [Pseudonocardiaceae bacterium]|jgi:ABC-type nitrate/sulfonate/bicarbonate transport system permease component|nr:ABC transporter permease subunit [Pseudonocardiaceae bacterium]
MTTTEFVEQLEPSLPEEPAGLEPVVRRRRRTPAMFLARWLFFLVCVLVWQYFTARANSTVFTTPWHILGTIRTRWLSGPASHLFLSAAVNTDILSSIELLLLGWVVSCVAGTVLGMLIGLSQILSDYTSAVLAFCRAMPPVMLLPVFLSLFHVGTELQLATIVFGAVWPVLLNAVDGARSVDPGKIETAKAFRLGWWRRVFGIVLPAALPKIFTGFRVALGLSLILLVLSQMTGATKGLGYVVNAAGLTFDYATMWAGIVVIGVIGYILNRLLIMLEYRVLAWHRGSTGLSEG